MLYPMTLKDYLLSEDKLLKIHRPAFSGTPRIMCIFVIADILFPFGSSSEFTDTMMLPSTDDTTHRLSLTNPIKFFNVDYDEVFVNLLFFPFLAISRV